MGQAEHVPVICRRELAQEREELRGLRGVRSDRDHLRDLHVGLQLPGAHGVDELGGAVAARDVRDAHDGRGQGRAEEEGLPSGGGGLERGEERGELLLEAEREQLVGLVEHEHCSGRGQGCAKGASSEGSAGGRRLRPRDSGVRGEG